MQYRLKIDPDLCIGCRSCELACSLENDGIMASARSRISVIGFIEGNVYELPYNFPTTCKQCKDAPCLAACPEDAIRQDQKAGDVIVIDTDRCTGCRKCVRACPYGAMGFDENYKRPFKCELCGGGRPACAEICPSDAICFQKSRAFYAKGQALSMAAYEILKKPEKAVLPGK